MDAFVRECYDMGTCPMCLNGISTMKARKFLVVNAYDVRAAHPGIDLAGMDEHRENGIRQGNTTKSEQEHKMNLERTIAENTVSQHPIIWYSGSGRRAWTTSKPARGYARQHPE